MRLLPIIVLFFSLNNLGAWYQGYNYKYFQDELPAAIITRNLHDDRFMALTEYHDNYYHIEFNPKYNLSPRQERETLLHEMCHIEVLASNDTEFDDHGIKWQTCMKDLAKKGAFDDLW